MGNPKVLEAPGKSIAEGIIDRFRTIVGAEFVISDNARMEDYGHDKTEDYFFMPDVVVKPRTAGEISELLKICHTNKIPVTPRGAGTGLSGGALPVKNGLVISMERFNKILQIDE